MIKTTISSSAISEYREKKLKEHLENCKRFCPADVTIEIDGHHAYFDFTRSTPMQVRSRFVGALRRMTLSDKTVFDTNRIGKVVWDEYTSVAVTSEEAISDELFKKIAIECAKSFQVTLILYTYNGETEEVGALKCKYCGSFTKNIEKCDTCGGAPLVAQRKQKRKQNSEIKDLRVKGFMEDLDASTLP